jgi:phytol kinase
LLFNPAPESRWLAALVPFLITGQFIFVGLGIIKDETAVQAMSRTGDRREILRGPLYYGVIFIALTLLFWKEKPAGIAALMIMCGGDGLADIIGRSYPIMQLPWNRNKSLGGSISVFVGGYITSVVVISIFTAAGFFPGSYPGFFTALIWITLAATFVESLPIKDIDNITVSVTALVVGLILM